MQLFVGVKTSAEIRKGFGNGFIKANRCQFVQGESRMELLTCWKIFVRKKDPRIEGKCAY